MKTVAIIQARMGSARLPGKVLMDLAGQPVLWHIVSRLRRCQKLDEIAIATTTREVDQPVVSFAGKDGIRAFRGPEDNVLSRILQAAEALSADIILRVCGDSPLIDPVAIDRLIEALIESGADYCIGDPETPTVHEGFSPFTVQALRKLSAIAGDDPLAREHVTAYFKQHPELFHTVTIPFSADYRLDESRLSIDHADDLRLLNEIYSRLHVPAGEADVRDVVNLLRSEPDLLQINKRSLNGSQCLKKHVVLFRCDGDEKLGLGHVSRCLALADELKTIHECGVTFAVGRGILAENRIREAGYPVELKPASSDESTWLNRIVQRLRPETLVLDIRSDISKKDAESWRDKGLLIVSIDDPTNNRLLADLVFYPPVPQVNRLDWSTFSGERFVGWEWLILDKSFYRMSVQKKKAPGQRQRNTPAILVSMGGTDPQGMTVTVVSALKKLGETFSVTLVLGAGFSHKRELEEVLDDCRFKVDVYKNVKNMPELMAASDFAIISFGVTAYELAVMEVPSLYLCLTHDHAESAAEFVRAGLGESAGIHGDIKVARLAQSVKNFLKNRPFSAQPKQNSSCPEKKPIDGRGVERVAGRIMKKLNRMRFGSGQSPGVRA